ncbi:MAG: hypothetical protein KGI73_02115 [Patescibacteria group bacterium]|nr:hypothetical protein [Patescibacteria group bacterium]
MVNLLPPTAKRVLAGTYYARLVAVVLFLLALGIGMSALLLAPSYFLVENEAAAAHQFLLASEQAVKLGAKGGASGVLALTTERVQILKTYAWSPQVARVLSALSAARSAGITLVTVGVQEGADGTGTLSVAGTAATRNDLLAFVDALKNTSLFSNVAVPLSDLAAQSKIPFTLSFSYATNLNL